MKTSVLRSLLLFQVALGIVCSGSCAAFAAEVLEPSDCYFVGKERLKLVSIIQMSVRKAAKSQHGPDIAVQQGRGYTNTLDLTVKDDCTIGGMNHVLRKFKACLLYTNVRDPKFAISIPDPKTYEDKLSVISALKKEKCVLEAEDIFPVPANM